MKYRKKPVVIEAIRWRGTNIREVELFVGASLLGDIKKDTPFLIRTLEGQHIASVGDWIIRGVKGEVYPCKPDIFTATYRKVEVTP